MLTCVTAYFFVGQDSRTSVTLCTACSALRAIPSLRSALPAFGGYVLIVRRFLYDVAPSAISSAELCLAYLWQSSLTLLALRRGKKVTLIGAAFDSEMRNLSDRQIEIAQ